MINRKVTRVLQKRWDSEESREPHGPGPALPQSRKEAIPDMCKSRDRFQQSWCLYKDWIEFH